MGTLSGWGSSRKSRPLLSREARPQQNRGGATPGSRALALVLSRDDRAAEQHRRPPLHDREPVALEEPGIRVPDVEDGGVATGLEDAGNLPQRLLALPRIVDVVQRQAGDDDIERRAAEGNPPRITVADVDADAFQLRVAPRGTGGVIGLIDVLPDCPARRRSSWGRVVGV